MTERSLGLNGSLFRKSRPKHQNGPSSPEKNPPPVGDTLTPVYSSAESNNSRPSTAFRDYSHRRDSSLSSIKESRPNVRRRSTSLRSRRANSPHIDNLALAPTSDPKSAATHSQRAPAPPLSSQHSSETVPPLENRPTRSQRPYPPSTGQKREEGLRPPAPLGVQNGSSRSVSLGNTSGGAASQNPRVLYQNIQDVAAKRVAMLDYLRKTNDGIWWFNAFHYTKSELHKMPYFDRRKLGRRAVNHLFLGISIPFVLDPNRDVAIDYLRAFNALLVEFESYETLHPPEGTAPSALSRVRIPQMFKRSTHSGTTKGRRGSSADAISPLGQADSADTKASGSTLASAGSTASFSSLSTSDQELMPGEEYAYLLTPSLPFDPDYFETFATLCDVVIDCYTRIMSLLNSPDVVSPAIADLFSKADAKIRKLLITGLVRDFEDATKQSIKTEIAGVGKVVLGGLM